MVNLYKKDAETAYDLAMETIKEIKKYDSISVISLLLDEKRAIVNLTDEKGANYGTATGKYLLGREHEAEVYRRTFKDEIAREFPEIDIISDVVTDNKEYEDF